MSLQVNKQQQYAKKFRTCWEVRKLILDYARKERHPTHMMRDVRLHYRELQKYLFELVEKGMLQEIETSVSCSAGKGKHLLSTNPKTLRHKVFKTTEKGIIFVEKVNSMIGIWDDK